MVRAEPEAALPTMPVTDGIEERTAHAPMPAGRTIDDRNNRVRRVRWWSLREPWRSVSIVAGIGFVATSWMLPDDVAGVSQVALGVLTLGSFYAAWRWREREI